MERKIQEAIRYLGIKKGAADAGTRALVESSFQELMKEAEPKSICRIFELQELGDGAVQIGKLKIESRSLARNLKNCRRAVLFGATLGTGTDRLITRTGLKDMARETYRKLSLLNPEKSVYFAELIAKLDASGAAKGASDGAGGTEKSVGTADEAADGVRKE